MKIFNFIFGFLLLIGFIRCEKENDDVVCKLENGSYMGSFSYDNNYLWEAFIIRNDSFIELASGGVMFQKFPEYCLTEGTFEIIDDSIFFKNINVAQPPKGNVDDYEKDYLLMGNYYIEESSNSTIVFSRMAKNGRQKYDLKQYFELK